MGLVKITNCKIITGGGTRKDATPYRIKHNQNIRTTIPDSWKELPLLELKLKIEELNKYRFLTTPSSKIVWNPESNYKITSKRLNKILKKLDIK